MAYYDYEYKLSLKSEKRDGEGENDVGIRIMVENVWRHCVSTTLSEPDGNLIVTYCDHRSRRGRKLTVDNSKMSASTHYAMEFRAYLFEVLPYVGVTLPSFQDVLVDKIISLVASATVPNRRTLHPVVEVCVLAVEYEDELNLDRAVVESMEEADLLRKPSPATEEAIGGLDKVRVEEGLIAEHCVVCLEDFHKGEDVTCMPCSHVYHEECIVKWLGTSHMCPVCRYELPKIDNV